MSLSEQQRVRFNRNIVIPGIGEEGQEKLLRSSALIVGCGGLGSSSALYLAAAGLGRIGLVDFDVVELSNLQRQVMHKGENLGMPKTISATLTLQALNPGVSVEPYQLRIDEYNAVEIFQGYDVIIDATDNFDARYVINAAAHGAGKPAIMGAVLAFSGQLTTIIPGKTPCYRCLFPTPPPEEVFPGGRAMGIMGTSPGIIGCLQATEALKLILGLGDLLLGRLLIYDGLGMDFEVIPFFKRPDCPVCGTG
jgi:adenylyltransferase/sulfurtransferase